MNPETERFIAMQLLEHWDPLKLPRGSIRALVTLLLLATFWILLLLGHPPPVVLGYLVVLIVAYYFGSRSGQMGGQGRPPLYLPRGSIRAIILIGSAVAGYFSWQLGRLELAPDQPSFGVLILTGALLLGFLVRKLADLVSRGKATPPRRWFENLKSIVVLMAAVLVATLSTFRPDDAGSQNLLLIAGPIVGFYFGSRR